MKINFPSKAWKKIDKAKEIISKYEGSNISDPTILVEISKQFSSDYNFDWLTNERKMLFELPKVLEKIIQNRKTEFDFETDMHAKYSNELEENNSMAHHEELMREYTISTLKHIYVMFSEYASSRFRFSAGTFEEVARQHYGNYALEISWNLDWLIDEGYIEDLGHLEKWKDNVYRIIPSSMK